MARPRSYGSTSNRNRRREVARKNAQAEQVKCKNGAGTHRAGRPCQGS